MIQTEKQQKKAWRAGILQTAKNAPDQGFDICVLVEPLMKTWARLQSGEDEIWERLSELGGEACSAKYLATVTDLTPARVSQRLAGLTKSGFVKVAQNANPRLYAPNLDACLQFTQFVEHLTNATASTPDALTRMFGLLSLPANYLIWHRLLIGNSTVTELTEYMKAKQAEVSAALAALRSVGMVGFEREGNSKRYFSKKLPFFIEPAEKFLIETGFITLPVQEVFAE